MIALNPFFFFLSNICRQFNWKNEEQGSDAFSELTRGQRKRHGGLCARLGVWKIQRDRWAAMNQAKNCDHGIDRLLILLFAEYVCWWFMASSVLTYALLSLSFSLVNMFFCWLMCSVFPWIYIRNWRKQRSDL